MKIDFTKFQGTGNDFVMLDNLSGRYDNLSLDSIAFICNRKMGVGADGLIKLSEKEGYDFHMEYYNADGSQSFCGNGARCAVAFARQIQIIKNEARFYAIDGAHYATIKDDIVRLEMLPVDEIQQIDEDYFVDTGSPHYIHYLNGKRMDIVEFGRSVRYSELFRDEGVNVNLLNKKSKTLIEVETYERGVEDETLSCGTGVTACALVQMTNEGIYEGSIDVRTKGGDLSVEAKRNGEGFDNIWLIGPAKAVFNGRIDV